MVAAAAVRLRPGGLNIVLRQHDQGSGDRFEETRPGLDHLSFAVGTIADLDQLEDSLTAASATFAPRQEQPYGWLLAFRDPDNIALEAMLPR